MFKKKLSSLVANEQLLRQSNFEIIHDASAMLIVGGMAVEPCPKLTNCANFSGTCSNLVNCGTYTPPAA
jgi:hypothetical protein